MHAFSNDVLADIEFTVIWTHENIRHEERFLGHWASPAGDIFPRGMRKALEGKKTGESVEINYEPRMCIPRYKDNQVTAFGLDRLRPRTMNGRPIVPGVGRYYPYGHINRLLGIHPDTLTPFRMTALDDTTFTCDLNHPLARIPVTIKATVGQMQKDEYGPYGQLTHWRETTCDWGPGMQARLDGETPDFFHPAFFDVAAPDAPIDRPVLDALALENFRARADRLTQGAENILDFSSGDVPAGEYDAAVCFLGMEYVPDPIALLSSVSKTLRPGSPAVVGFSNLYDPNRVIQGWIDLHDFERPAVVLDYFRQVGLDNDMGTMSARNDRRPKDAPRYQESRGISDPVFIAYGHTP